MGRKTLIKCDKCGKTNCKVQNVPIEREPEVISMDEALQEEGKVIERASWRYEPSHITKVICPDCGHEKGKMNFQLPAMYNG